MCQINKCCCFSLRTGCMIIGVLDLFVYVSPMVADSVRISNETTTVGFGALFITMAALSIIAAGALIFGVMKENAAFLLVWLLFKGISLVMMCTLVIWVVIAVIAVGTFAEDSTITILIFVAYIVLVAAIYGFSIYWWYVVKSYRKVLKARLPK